jgi:integrase
MRGTITKRSKGSWRIVVDAGRDPFTGKRVQHTETIRGTKAVADQRLTQILSELDSGVYVKTPQDLTVAAYLREWLESYVSVNCAPQTQESYRFIAERHIIPELGNLRLVDLEARQLQTLYARKKAAGLSTRTVRYCYSLMSQALGYAVRQGILARNVAAATTPPRLRQKPMATLAPEDVERFLVAAGETPYYALFHLLLHTGMRRGEALALRWRNVDFGLESLGMGASLSISQSLGKIDGQIQLKEPKTASGKRRVPLPPSSVLVLRQHRAEKEARMRVLERSVSDTDFVFTKTEGGPLDPSTVSKAFLATIRKAGLPDMPLHGLRHTHATILLSTGTHPKVVQERLGHASIRETLDTYSHAVAGLQEAAVLKFDEFLAAKRKVESDVTKM